MRTVTVGRLRRSAKSRLSAASSMVLENMESRTMLSTTVASWSFSGTQAASAALVSPATGAAGVAVVNNQTAGTPILTAIGMTASGTTNNMDIAPTAGTAHASFSESLWRIRGTGSGSNGDTNGWWIQAPQYTQGAEIDLNTSGITNLNNLTFDWYCTTSGVKNMMVQYNTNTTNSAGWTNVLATPLSGAANDYYGLASASPSNTIDLSGITLPADDANFGIRLVSAYDPNFSSGAYSAANSPTSGTQTLIANTGGNWRFGNIAVTGTFGAALAAPTVSTSPTDQTVVAGQPVSFTAAGMGNPIPTVQWYKGSVGSGTLIGGATSATYTFTTSADGSENGSTYYAVFTNSQGTASTTAATLNDPLAAVSITTQPAAVSVAAGNTANFTAAATGSPLPTVKWQSSPNGTSGWTDIAGATSTTYSFTASPTLSGTYYRAVFTNSQTPSGLATNAAKLTAAGTILAAWSFPTVVAAPVNSPAATGGVLAASATAASLGMTNTYTYAVTTATNSVTNDDITSVAGAGTVTENVWRVRGHYVATGTAPNIGTPASSGNVNGWNLNAPQYNQGVEFDVSTAGYQTIQAAFDWESTAAGVRNLQEQYNLDTTNNAGWTNINAPLVAVAGNYLLANPIDLSGIPSANNDVHFGIRLVSVYDPAFPSSHTYSSASSNNTTQTVYNNSSGNWGFDNVQITGVQIPAAPAVTTQPASTSVLAGTDATFTAAASGFPAPTVQWQVSTDGTTFTDIVGATSATCTVPAAPAADNGYQYRAVFTNSLGSATTNPATLTVTVAPAITTQPLSQTVAAGASNITFTAGASGNPTPTVQWMVSVNGGATFTNINGATSTTYIIPSATEGLTGNEYEAVFTNASGTAATAPATLTVIGTPVAQWIFTGGQAPPAGGSTTQGTANSPYPTFGPVTNTAGTLGFKNTYTGLQAFPESDILIERSGVNTGYTEYDWRVRSGNGLGPTGSPGTPEGWSQTAPQWDAASIGTLDSFNNLILPQGVQFNVNTSGYSNVTFQFDWQQNGGISDMQPQYSPDGGGHWYNAPSGVITQTGTDFYGVTATTAPTPIVVNLQSVAAANNNPNFELRLVAAYNASLPLISDGNALVPAVHGQYGKGAPGIVNAQQVLQFNSGISSGDTFTLTYGGNTQTVAYSSSPATLIANLNTALTALVGLGNFSVAPTNYTDSTETILLQPVRDALGSQTTDMTVTFKGTLAATAVPIMTTTNSNVVIATWVNGSTTGVAPYVDGGSAWQIGKFSFNGDGASTAGGLAITASPTAYQVAGGGIATFTATAYDEASGATAQWQVNTGSGWSNIGGTTNISNSGATCTSTYTFTTNVNLSDTGHQFRAVFTQGSSSVTSGAATLTVVTPVAPTITLQPANTSVQAGNIAFLTATANSSTAPSPTVQWQISTNGGTAWNNLTDTGGYLGSQTLTLQPSGYLSNLSVATQSNTSQTGYQYRAVFSNAIAATTSNVATLTVLATETIITHWDFSGHSTDVSTPASAGFDNAPVPIAGTGTASAVGMVRAYDPNDQGSGIDGNGSVAACDVVNSPSVLNPTFNENTWRIRGGPTATTGGTPANGWSNLAPEYTQGAQFSVPTTGYTHIYVTLDWYATTSGILDAQEQYTLDGTTWTNINNQVQANSNDFYGATAAGGPVPLVIDVSAIPGAANDPTFGVRLVSAYNPLLPNITDVNGTHGQYANAALVGNPPGPAPYNGSKGNWRFDNIQVHGVSTVPALPTWLAAGSVATWDSGTHALTVSGAATIIADPGTDEPVITASGAAAQLTINTAAQLVQNPTLFVHVGGISLSNGAGIDFLAAGTTRSHDKHGVLVLGTVGATAAPLFSVDAIHGSKVDLEDNDLIVHGGDLAGVQALAAAGRNVAAGGVYDGTWDGKGLTSSTAAAIDNPVTGSAGYEQNVLAVALNSDLFLGQFARWTVGSASEPLRADGNDVLVKYTYNGDLALEGQTGGDAATVFGTFYDPSAIQNDYAFGDLNGDGKVDGTDASIFGTVYGLGLNGNGPVL